MPYATPITREHLKTRVKVNEDGCWIWQLSVDRHGYGLLAPGAQERLAHRLSYRLFIGEIPDDLTVDHICFTTDCLNPEHLQLLSVSDNCRRRSGTHRPIPTRTKTPQTQCKRGHTYTPETTWVDKKGKRTCRTCVNAQRREKRRLAKQDES